MISVVAADPTLQSQSIRDGVVELDPCGGPLVEKFPRLGVDLPRSIGCKGFSFESVCNLPEAAGVEIGFRHCESDPSA